MRSTNGRQTMRGVLISLALILSTSSAVADRPLTQEEVERLQTALKEQGCSGGKMEFDDGNFEVERATCADGKTYDLEFDSSLRLIKKKLKHAQTGNGPGGKPLPKLVLFMVIDGFPQEQFVKYYDQYTKRGFKLLLDKGGWYGNNHYSHATTYTSPDWWKGFYESKPQNKYFKETWSLLLPEEAYARSIADDRPWTTKYKDLGTRFPHPIVGGAKEPSK